MKIRKIIVYLCVFAAAASIFTRIIYVNKVYPSVKIHNYNIGDTVNTDEYQICLDSVKVYEKAEWENYIDSTQYGLLRGFRHDVSPRIFRGNIHFRGSETALFHLPGSFKECQCGSRPVTESILLRKAIRNPVLFRFRAHFCPTLFCSCIRSNFPLEIEGAGNFDLFKQHEIGA